MPPPSPIRSVTQVMSMPCSVLLLDALRNRFLAIILILILLHPSPGSSTASLEPLPLTPFSRSARSPSHRTKHKRGAIAVAPRLELCYVFRL
jgi:hypothetical protein